MPLARQPKSEQDDKIHDRATQHDLDEFFTGPAFLPWNRMGNINAHAGPLPQSWIDGQKDLQKKILIRERELGMSPIIPAFSGFVPPAFGKNHVAPGRSMAPDARSRRWRSSFTDPSRVP